MLQSIPTPYSPDAADAADRLRLLKCDLRLVDLAVQRAVTDDDDQQAILMHVRRMIGDTEKSANDRDALAAIAISVAMGGTTGPLRP